MDPTTQLRVAAVAQLTWLSDLAVVAELGAVVVVLDDVSADGASDHDTHVAPVSDTSAHQVGVGERVDAVVVVVVPGSTHHAAVVEGWSAGNPGTAWQRLGTGSTYPPKCCHLRIRPSVTSVRERRPGQERQRGKAFAVSRASVGMQAPCG